MKNNPLISVIIPCYNEEEAIPETYRRLNEVMKPYVYELIFVDDSSSDNTVEYLETITLNDKRVKVIKFSRNFGHQIAVSAGIDHSSGEIVVLIDADLQDPPEVIPLMINKLENGFDVVYGKRIEREKETLFKKISAKIFYRLINHLSDIDLPADVGDFRVMRRSVVDILRVMPEKDRYLRGMISWIGFKQTSFDYRREMRYAGVTKYPLRKMVSFAVSGLISFSTRPLRFTIFLGLLVSFFGFMLMLYVFYVRIYTNNWVSGWATILISLLLIGGLLLIQMGIIGEYIGRIYLESKNRPLYIIDKIYNKE